ncbi:MAG: GldG family protein [Oscillospiraceae bacterium]|nr:GldG family protein [Oscillospiraceae bacterium]
MSKKKKTADLEIKEKKTVKEKAEDAVKEADKTEITGKKPEKKPRKPRLKFNKRSIKRGALSVVLTILFVAAVVVVNVIVGIVSDRVNTAADLTTAGIYSLDEKTENFLNDTLSYDVEITVLNSEKAFEDQDSSYKQVNELLKKMEMTGGHVKVKYLDIDQNPNYTAQFKGETLSTNYIVVECEKTGRHRIISPYDYFSFNQDYLQYYGAYVVEGSNIEQETVSAMMYTTSDRLVRVAFTEGYNEGDGSSALKNLLSKNGYAVESLPLLTTAEIDSEIDYVVIYAPTIDMDKDQLAKLDKFLDNNGKFGKNLVYFASTTQPKTPNIDEFLSDWGLSVGYDVIGQTDENYLMSATTLYAHLQKICDTDYTKNVYGTKLYTYGMEQRPVYALDGSTADRTVLMTTYDKAFLYPLDEEEAKDFKYDSAVTGEFNDVVISQKTTEGGVKSRVCAVGSDLLASNVMMSYSNSNNAEFFVGIWNFISGREQGMTIKGKSLTPTTFEMNVKTANTLSVVLCIIVPICVIVFGIVIWLRRRHR